MKKNNQKILKITIFKLKNYFLIFMAFLVLFGLATFWLISKIKQTEAEVVSLKANLVPQAEAVNKDTMLLLENRASEFASFLPDEFNLYQVIGLIEQIGKKTKFTIQSYKLDYVEGTVNQLQHQSLSIQGSGTLDQFMAFLKEYKFITGKLLTIDSVNLSGGKRLLSDLQINIYAYKPEIVIHGETIGALGNIDRFIVSKLDKYHVAATEVIPDTSYTNKEDPFNKIGN